MKKLFLGLAVVSAVALTSCGGKTETKEVIEVRMKKASEEVKMINKYDYVVVNDKLNTAVEEVIAIIRAEHLKANRANTID